MLSRYLQSLVFGVEVTDPLTFGLMGAALLVVAIAACTLPALRAMRVDLVALRAD
ncbi:MAG: hypothetical protein H0X67_20960 [Acidobacteria bacterium]|nr:hypothetical protein [Acidobacteriota bacterium]